MPRYTVREYWSVEVEVEADTRDMALVLGNDKLARASVDVDGASASYCEALDTEVYLGGEEVS